MLFNFIILYSVKLGRALNLVNRPSESVGKFLIWQFQMPCVNI